MVWYLKSMTMNISAPQKLISLDVQIIRSVLISINIVTNGSFMSKSCKISTSLRDFPKISWNSCQLNRKTKKFIERCRHHWNILIITQKSSNSLASWRLIPIRNYWSCLCYTVVAQLVFTHIGCILFTMPLLYSPPLKETLRILFTVIAYVNAVIKGTIFIINRKKFQALWLRLKDSAFLAKGFTERE